MSTTTSARPAAKQVTARIATLSERHAGTVSRALLLQEGVTASAIDRRLRAGQLFTFLPGTYLVGHAALTPERIWWAAVLSGGPHAVLAGRSCLEVHELLTAQPAEVIVAVPRSARSRVLRSRRAWEGQTIRVRLVRPRAVDLTLPPRRDRRFGLPTLDVHRALIQMAPHERDFNAALREAEFRRLITDERLRAELRRGRPGSQQLRVVVDKRAIGSMIVRNGLEDEGIELFAALGMPRPETNVWVQTPRGPVHVDFWFPLLNLVIEFDGRDAHESVDGTMRDHEKAAKLREAGIDVMHFNWWQATKARHEISGALIGAGYLPRG